MALTDEYIDKMIVRNEYIDKISNAVYNQIKLKLLRRNATEKSKTKTNKIIASVNADQCDIKLQKIIGNFNPDHLYVIYQQIKNMAMNYPLSSIFANF